MYIYQGHLGGLYASDEPLEYDALYCEECGDSDQLVGKAETAQEAFDLLTQNIQDDCKNCEKYGKCHKEPVLCEYTGGYAFPYIMNFIAGEFPESVSMHVFVLARGKDNTTMVNCHPQGHEWGEHAVPSAPCIFPKYADEMALSCCGAMEEPDPESLKKLAEVEKDGKTYVVYEILENGRYEKDAAWYAGNGWYGYLPKSDISLINDEKWLGEYL